MDQGTTIGREGCDITLGDPDVSRRHAEIQVSSGEIPISDLGSTNGTFVNGERIDQPRALRDGDEVRIGAVVWRLRAPGRRHAPRRHDGRRRGRRRDAEPGDDRAPGRRARARAARGASRRRPPQPAVHPSRPPRAVPEPAAPAAPEPAAPAAAPAPPRRPPPTSPPRIPRHRRRRAG